MSWFLYFTSPSVHIFRKFFLPYLFSSFLSRSFSLYLSLPCSPSLSHMQIWYFIMHGGSAPVPAPGLCQGDKPAAGRWYGPNVNRPRPPKELRGHFSASLSTSSRSGSLQRQRTRPSKFTSRRRRSNTSFATAMVLVCVHLGECGRFY